MRKLTEKDFWKYIRKEMKRNGFKLTLVDSKNVMTGECICSGYCDEEGKEIVVANDRDKNQVLQTIAHEFCHMQQMSTGDDCYKYPGYLTELGDAQAIVALWLSHHLDMSKAKAKYYVTMLQDVEYDCEKRAFELIKKYNLPIDLESFCRWANAYVFFYTLMARDRVWVKAMSVPSVDGLMNAAPSKILDRLEDYHDMRKFPKMVSEWKKQYADLNHEKAPD